MNDPLAYLGEQLEAWKRAGTYQRLRVLESESAAESRFDGKEVINLASNNYLGLTTHPKLREAALEATRRYGVGSGAVRTISGTMSLHMELEERIAELQERGSLRGVSVRIRRQRGHGIGGPDAGRSHHLRRIEPRQHHRRLPAFAGEDPRFPHKDVAAAERKLADLDGRRGASC